MRRPPKLADELILAAVQTHYGLAVTALTFLPLGNDSASSVYRVQTADSGAYFLKTRTRSGFTEPSLAVPRYLRDQGVPHVLAPLPTVRGALWVDLGAFAFSLYPFVDGRNGCEAGLSAQHWRAFGALMRQVHSLQLPPDVARIVPREAFVPSRRALIADLEAVAGQSTFVTAVEGEFAATWRARAEVIREVVARADALAERLRGAPAPFVLCHADMHPWNLLIDAERDLWLIDWDETILARRERDLMFVVGGIGGPQPGPTETRWFFDGYGETALDPIALAYYRCAWAVQDIAAYGEQVCFLPDQDEDSRRDALRGFISLFAPGSIVPLALATPLD